MSTSDLSSIEPWKKSLTANFLVKYIDTEIHWFVGIALQRQIQEISDKGRLNNTASVYVYMAQPLKLCYKLSRFRSQEPGREYLGDT